MMEVTVYRSVRRRKGSALVLLLASLGVYVVCQNLLSLAFGDDVLTFPSGEQSEGLHFFGGRISRSRCIILAVAVASFAGCASTLRMTRAGKCFRAVVDSPDLARISGIDPDRTVLWAFLVGSGLAGVVGVLVALDLGMTPLMGLGPLMTAVVALILAGHGRVLGIAVASTFVAVVQQVVVWYLGSKWQDAAVFGILLVLLVVTPRGLAGTNERVMSNKV
jgi:branched-subunit amino acid ABC-type transport system permease component